MGGWTFLRAISVSPPSLFYLPLPPATPQGSSRPMTRALFLSYSSDGESLTTEQLRSLLSNEFSQVQVCKCVCVCLCLCVTALLSIRHRYTLTYLYCYVSALKG